MWQGRPDFMFGDKYVVPTITLKNFIKLYDINHIDYLWIDAQGHDFNVIKGLGDSINIVKEGRCEAAHNVHLYGHQDNYFQDILNYLHTFNFDTQISLDHSGFGAECDITFKLKL